MELSNQRCGQFGHDEENCDLSDMDDDDDKHDNDDNDYMAEIHSSGKGLFNEPGNIFRANGHIGRKAENLEWLREIAESYLWHYDITITFALLREYDQLSPGITPDTALSFCGG